MEYTSLLNEKNPVVRIIMESEEVMEVELFPSIAPETVANFLQLVSENFYTGLIFHRVISGFMIQGGDPLGNGRGGSKKCIKGEFNSNGFKNDLHHSRGVISMARSSNPNSASSQFFIMHDDASYLDGNYAAFGALISGFEVLDKIASSKTDYSDKPLIDQKIKKMEIKK